MWHLAKSRTNLRGILKMEEYSFHRECLEKFCSSVRVGPKRLTSHHCVSVFFVLEQTKMLMQGQLVSSDWGCFVRVVVRMLYMVPNIPVRQTF